VNGFLLDTNIVSELIKPRPDIKVVRWIESIDESYLFLSVLLLGEIRKGISLLAEPVRRAKLESWLNNELTLRFSGRILAVDKPIADLWGRFTAQAVKSKSTLTVIDGLLAATSHHHDLVLVTRNTKDVASTGISAFNPWL